MPTLIEKRAAVRERPSPAGDDALLIRRCRACDEAAFAELVDRFSPFVYRVVRRMVYVEDGVEDIVQEAFIQVFRNIGRFRGDSALSTWIYRIAINAARMHLRAQRVSKRIPREALVPIDPDGHMRHIPDWTRIPERTLLRRDLRRTLDSAIAGLPTPYRTVYLLAEVEGLPHAETARVLGVRVPTVKTRLHRARLQLRRILAETIEEERI